MVLMIGKVVAATQIQKTWRSYVLDREAHLERAEAQLNKINNKDCSDENRYNEDPRKIKKKTVVISDLSMACEGSLREMKDMKHLIYAEEIELVDSNERSSYAFTVLTKMWKSWRGQGETFFTDKTVHKYLKIVGEDGMDEFMDLLINRCEDGFVTRLWGHTGGYMIVYPLNKGKYNDMREMWKTHLEENEKENPTTKKSTLNPGALAFVPSWSSKGSPEKKKEVTIEDLDEKLQKLLTLQATPVCIALPL
jgi:hypothetical protein